MSEFANMITQRAADLLRRTFQQETPREANPLLELIGVLLEDGAGGVMPSLVTTVTTEQWQRWNQLALERPQELILTMTEVLEQERTQLPAELGAMQNWAACLLLSTIDQMEIL